MPGGANRARPGEAPHLSAAGRFGGRRTAPAEEQPRDFWAIRALDSTRTDLRVGIFQSVATAILPSILRELRAEMTDLEVRTTEAIDPLHLLDRVAQGELDLAFANPTHDGRLESCPLIEDPYIVLVAAGHPLAAARCVSATALAEWPLIAYRTVPDRLYPPAIEIDPEAVVYRTDDDAAIRAMVAYCQRINDSGD